MTESFKKNPKTAVVQTRCDRRTLAMMAKFWASQGTPARSISDLCRISLEAFCHILTTNDQVDQVETQSDANQFLEHYGLSSGINPVKNLRSMLEAMKIDSLKSEGVDPSYASGGQANFQEMAAEALKRMQEEEGGGS